MKATQHQQNAPDFTKQSEVIDNYEGNTYKLYKLPIYVKYINTSYYHHKYARKNKRPDTQDTRKQSVRGYQQIQYCQTG